MADQTSVVPGAEAVNQLEAESQQVATLLIRVSTVTVTDAASNVEAARMLSLVKGRAKEIDTLRRSMTRPLDDSKKRIMDMFRPVEQDLADAEQHVKGVMLEWDRAERQRLDQERAAAAAERQRLADEAMRAARQGRYAEAKVAAEDSLVVPEPPKIPPKVHGTAVVYTWHAEVVDMEALVLAIATGDAPISLIQVNQRALTALARGTKQEGEMLPGVRFWRESGIRADSSRIR